MNKNQTATINGLVTVAGCIAAIGFVLLLWDGNNTTEICGTSSWDCEDVMNMRGAYLLVAGIVALVGLAVAHKKLQTLTPVAATKVI